VPEDENHQPNQPTEKNKGEKGDGKESKVYAGEVTKYQGLRESTM